MLSTLRLTLTAAALLLSTRTAVAEDKPACAENASRAQCDFQDGRWYLQQGDFGKAAELFKASLAVEPLGDTAVAYAKALERLGRAVEAYDQYAQALGLFEAARLRAEQAGDSATSTLYASRLTFTRGELGTLQAKIGRIRLRLARGSSAAGLVVTRPEDGDVSTSLDEPFAITPGDGTLTLSYGDGRPQEVEYSVGAGQVVTIDGPRASAPGRSRTKTWIGIGLVGAGVAGLGVAGLSYLGAKGDRSDAADLCLPDDRCDPPYNALIDSAEGKERTALVAGIAGVVAIGGGVTLMLLDRGGRSAGAERSVVVRVRPSAQGLIASLVGRF